MLPLVISPDRNYNCLMSSTFAVTVQPAARMRGRVRPPGDKSISHRYAMLAAIADGPSVIHGYSTGARLRLDAELPARRWACRSSRSDATRETGIQLEILGLQVGGLAAALLHARRRQLRAARCGCSPASSRRIRSARRLPATARCAAGRCAGSSSRSSGWARGFISDEGRPPLTIDRHGST